MDSFYITVIIIAIIFLIILLTAVGLMMSNSNATAPFPPISNMCPDYWGITTNSTGKNLCVVPDFNSINSNKGNLYNSNGLASATLRATPGISADYKTVDFTHPAWASKYNTTSICGQKQWGNSVQVSWDGVTNYNKC